MLLEAKADPNAIRSSDGATSLLRACSSDARKHANVALLLGAGADPNMTRPEDLAGPLYLAAKAGDAKLMKLLVDAGANVNQATSNTADTPLLSSADKTPEMVAMLLAAGARSTVHSDGMTPLSKACAQRKYKIVDMLLATSTAE